MVSLSHATVGSNDLTKAKGFYDALFASVGMTGLFDHPSGGRFYGRDGVPCFGVLGPYDKRPATIGNGVMIAFKCDDQEEVRKLYSKALALGGKDEGAPGERAPGAYLAYFRDLEGNKLCAYCRG